MGKKRYNWKARQVVKAVVDNSKAKEVQLDLDIKGSYDESNQLILPSKKGLTKIIDNRPKITRILSKKHRKKLEKIVDKKKKKENRASLLESLQKVQATPEELSQLTSLASVQTKGLKKHFKEIAHPESLKIKNTDFLDNDTTKKINPIKGAYRKRKLLLQQDNDSNKRTKISDPNVVGFSDIDDDPSDSEPEISNIENNEKNVVKEEATTDNVVIDLEENLNVKTKPSVEGIESKKIEKSKNKNKNTAIKKTKPIKPAVYVDVLRTEDVQAARLKLPILAEEQQIMETINENSIVIIAGETGSGKTTQLPQFLYEAGYALEKQIVITEPRRVAAISMSQRVAHEMNLSSRDVSYLMRFEGNVTEDTKIKFVTDGVLFKEMQEDFLLKKYSVIIIDEAHERSAHTDMLLGCLSRMVPLRQKKGEPVKLIIMSATLRLKDFIDNPRLFKIPPPVIDVQTRQYSVTTHFNKRTEQDYLKAAYRKVVKINTTLPEGGVLIFVTGQREVNYLVRKLRKTFPLRHKDKLLESEENEKKEETQNNEDEEDCFDDKKKIRGKRKKIKVIPKINLDDYTTFLDSTIDNLSNEEYDGQSSDEDDVFDDVTVYRTAQPLWTLPLYSMLPTHKQQKVFQQPPIGCRLCIVSTNVAETSLTIPNIKYVVDCGKAKVKLYDKITGLTRYMVQWTSKASANQRTGRAGRTGPGHCYRLYSSAVFNDEFPEFDTPEIQLMPIDDLYLQMKCMKIPNIAKFPFPSPPDTLQFTTAEQRLEILGALKNGKITRLGQTIAKLPVSPRYGVMLVRSNINNLLPYTVCLVANLSVQEVLLETPLTPNDNQKETQKQWAAVRQRWAGQGNSLLLGDNGMLLRAIGAAEYEHSKGKLQEFCDRNGLRYKAVIEIRKLRLQITSEIKAHYPDYSHLVVDPKMEPPSDHEAKLLREVVLCGMGDKLAKKVSLEEVKDREDKAKFKYAYWANNMKEPVFLHSSSVLRRTLPEFVCFNEIYETNKIYMRGVTAIDPEWIPIHVPAICNLSEPLAEPPPFYDEKSGKVRCYVTGTVGSQAWELPRTEIQYPEGLECIKWFARFLLEGRPFPKLEKFKKNLLSQPNVMVKNWANLQPRTQMLLKVLLSKQISSKTALESVWEHERQYLLQAYLSWVPESLHSQVTLIWPPLDT
ncbi:hypothetical protein ABEB36_006778 [Hypothenemus hampei]|uniref:RNA helicase n=1 Tax=Hypothenemus hampei TaxID=57062 RepID=A0ABD1ETZ3_HYPHA